MRKDDASFVALLLIPPLIPALILFKYVGIESLLPSIASISAGVLIGFGLCLGRGGSLRPRSTAAYTIALVCVIALTLSALPITLGGSHLAARVVEDMLLIALSATAVGIPITVHTKGGLLHLAGAAASLVLAFLLYSVLGPAEAILVLLLPIVVTLCVGLCLYNRYEGAKELARSTLMLFFTLFSIFMTIGIIASVIISHEESCVGLSVLGFVVSIIMLTVTAVVYSFIGNAVWCED